MFKMNTMTSSSERS